MTPTKGFPEYLAACDRMQDVAVRYARTLLAERPADLAVDAPGQAGGDGHGGAAAGEKAAAEAAELGHQFNSLLAELRVRAEAVAARQRRRGEGDPRPEIVKAIVREAKEAKVAWRRALQPAMDLVEGAGPVCHHFCCAASPTASASRR